MQALSSPSLWEDPCDGAIGEVVAHYQRGAPRTELSAVRALWRAAAPARLAHHIVVVGTNGKTSTATYVARLLGAMGVKTGLYTSPHIARWSERLRIDGEPCEENDLLETLRRYDEVAQTLGSEVRETLRFFDLLTLVAEDLFARQGVEVGVFEAGIGGRLDATRVLEPGVVALSSVGLDHRELLGDTPEEILLEKLAVAPPGATLVSAPLTAELASAQRDWAAANDVSFLVAETSPPRTLERKDAMPRGLPRNPVAAMHDVPRFQRQNLAVAERVCRVANATFGMGIAEHTIANAVLQIEAQVLGRFQRGTIDGTPFLADSAHNANAWSELLATIDLLDERFVAVLALTRERRPAELVEAVREAAAIEALITTTTRVRAGHDAERLLAEFGADAMAVSAEETPEQAFAAGLRLAQERGSSLLVTGSTYLVADFLAWLHRRGGYGTLSV